MNLKIAQYSDLKNIPTVENGEPFVVVNKFDSSIMYTHFKKDMASFFSGAIIVRETVAKKIALANIALQSQYSNLTLFVAYGFRTLEIQKKYFKDEQVAILTENNHYKKISKEELKEIIHERVAVPEVAGHPTGGAVDITIYDKSTGALLDMGGKIADFSSAALHTFADGLAKEQKQNRALLLSILQAQEFCPFYKEWWHFSYGDKEWAFFYNKKAALYEQQKLTDVHVLVK